MGTNQFWGSSEFGGRGGGGNFFQINLLLKLIICYISSGATNIAEVSSGFHLRLIGQIHWALFIAHLISFLFCFICLLFYLFFARNLIVAHMQTSGQFKFALYITND